MPLKEPNWWYSGQDDWRARLLEPVGNIYSEMGQRRFKKRVAYRSRLPVICIGNFTAGGAGKTPLSVFVAERLVSRGEQPAFLTRGYGGTETGPLWVVPDHHRASAVGDEPILLSAVAPTLVARDRRAGIRAIEARSDAITAVIMDDGLQNPAVKKDLTIAVIDGSRGLGNRSVIPSGPLRARLEFQLEKTDAIVINDTNFLRSETSSSAGALADRLTKEFRRSFPGPVIQATTQPAGDVTWLSDKPVVAFAGIGHPQRFFDMLTSLGARIAVEMPYADHYPFSEKDADALLSLRARHDALLVTTQKDMARLANLKQNSAGLSRLAERAHVVGIETTFDAANHLRIATLISDALISGGYRSGNYRR
ncbi:MAG: tetraacyldisaccharide 4'-kinase [Hyphomicrobiaceae bacterium]